MPGYFGENSVERTNLDWVMIWNGDMMLAVLFGRYFDMATILTNYLVTKTFE